MRKLLLVVLLFTTVCDLKAQEINWGARVGMNISKFGGDSEWDDYKSKIGFHLGVAADYELKESLFLESGLYLTTKGAKFKEGGFKDKYNVTYLQLPILATYKYDLGNDLKLHGKIGPYFALGLAAKNKMSGDFDWDDDDYDWSDYSLMTKAGGYDDYNDSSDDDKVKGFGEDKTGLKRGDIGLLFGIGISKGNYYLGLNYELGLSNISAYDEGKAKTRSFNISLGYNF